MEYEIVELEEKTVIGISIRTNNQAPDVGAVIGGLWEKFFTRGIYEGVPDKRSGMLWDVRQEKETMFLREWKRGRSRPGDTPGLW